MNPQAPQFSPAGGIGTQYNGYTFTTNGWVPTPTNPTPTVPHVTPPSSGSNSIINTTNSQWSNFNNATNGLNSFVNTPDPYLQLFTEQKAANKLAAENAIASATAATERAVVKNEADRNATIAGLATAAEKTGLAPNSAYQLQVIQGAKDQFNTRFALLDQQEKFAIAKAKAAQAVGDTAVLKEQLDYAVKLRKEKADVLAEANKLDWEKYKFENLSAAQKASESRLSKKSSSAADGGYTPQELRKLRAAGIDSNNVTMSDNFLYGENKGVVPPKFTPTNLEELGGKGKVWDLALALGIERNINLSKQDEIDSLFSNPTLVSYVQEMLNNGYSIDEIIEAQ